MTMSGSTNWTLQRDGIITEALELILGAGVRLTSTKITSMARTLNSIAKGKAGQRIRLWSVDEKVKTFSAPDIVSNNGINYLCQLPHTSSASDEPGVGTNSSLYWVETSETAGGAWALSTAYNTPKAFDLGSDVVDIAYAYYRNSSGNDTPIKIISMNQYRELTDKDEYGDIAYLAIEKKLTKRVHLYPVTNTYTDVLHYGAVTRLEDWDGSNDDPDFPVNWIDFLTWELAYRGSFKFDVDLGTRDRLKLQAEHFFKDAKANDQQTDDNDFIEGAYQ